MRSIRRLAVLHPFRPLRRGETSNTTVIVIVLCVLAGFGLCICAPIGLALLLPAVQQAREAARRTQSRNNLQQIGLAMHNFNDVNSGWPGATLADDGTPLHSWQTNLLPYIDQNPLYSAINLDDPWNAPSNDGNFRIPIAVYQHPSEPETMTTTGYAASHYAANQNVSLPGHELTFSDVTDGLSNTIAAGEVSQNFAAWGDPANVRDPAAGINQGPAGFGSRSPGGCQMLLMDGSTRFVSENVSPEVLKALSTPDGGEAIGAF